MPYTDILCYVDRQFNVLFCLLGLSVPAQPIDVAHTTLSSEYAMIEWLVPEVAYTPETYTVIYGTDRTVLNYTSELVMGPSDITARNQMYSIPLRDLQPNTRYYYQVVAANSIGMNSSVVSELVTPLPGITCMIVLVLATIT